MSGQEEACRTARKTQERIGDRVSADYHFYREMEAKRKQKYKTFSLNLKPILKLIRKLRLEKLIRKHIGFFEKERRTYWGFLHVGCIYCNIRTEVYEVVELKEKGGDKNGERSFAKGLCKYRKEKIRLHYCKLLGSNFIPVSFSIETSFF